MKKSTLLTVVCLFVAILLLPTAQGQENETPPMYLVVEEFVSPSHFSDFWKAQSEGLKLFEELNLEMNFSCFRTNANSYYWVIPIKNFADIDKLFVQVMSNNKVLKENGFDASEKFRDLTTMDQFVVMWDKDLSYNPNPVDEDAPPHKFHKWTYVYLKSGHEKEAGEALKAYQKFYDSVEGSYTWNIYHVVLGNNMPCWVSHRSAESEMALLEHEAALQKEYGKDFQKLWGEFRLHIHDSKNVKGWFLPNWSRLGNE